MENLFDLNVLNFLILSVPGYFLLASAGVSIKSEFGWAAQSIFWGVLLVGLLNFIIPDDKYTELFSNPYSGMGVFSLLAMLVGYAIRKFKLLEKLKSLVNGLKTFVQNNTFK